MIQAEQKQVDPKYRKPVWYLAGPFYRYNENVKELAQRAGLRIIDATVTADRSHAADPDKLPTVTLKPEYNEADIAAKVTRQAMDQFRNLSPEQKAAAVAQLEAGEKQAAADAEAAAVEAARKLMEAAPKADAKK